MPKKVQKLRYLMLRLLALTKYLFHITTQIKTMQRKIITSAPVTPAVTSAPVTPSVTSDKSVLTLNQNQEYDTANFIYDEWIPTVHTLRAQGLENNYDPWGIKSSFSAVDWIGHQIPLEIIETGLVYNQNPLTQEIDVLGRKWFSVPKNISLMQLRIMPDSRAISTPDSVRCFIEFKYVLEGAYDNENNSISKLGVLSKGSANNNNWGKWRLAVTFNQETVNCGLITQEDLSSLYTYYLTMVEYQNEFYTSSAKATPETQLVVDAVKKCVLRLKSTNERKNSSTFFFQLGIEDRVDQNGEFLDKRVNVTNIIWAPGEATIFGKVGFNVNDDGVVTFQSHNEGGNRPSIPLKIDPSTFSNLGLY